MTYRSANEKNAIWQKYVYEWGTRKKFLKDPVDWWNSFWLRTHETPQFLTAVPNRGHRAIARIVARCNARIITQNIDRLHLSSLCGNTERLVEVHGRLGLYKCISPSCVYNYDRSVPCVNYESHAVPGTSLDDFNLHFKTPPLCPNCEEPLLPQSLLFDEQYESHSFYKWDTAQEWMRSHDSFVFVGTSFSVGVTCQAIEYARKYGKKMYNFNLVVEDSAPEMCNIIGASENTLPTLYSYMEYLSGSTRGIFSLARHCYSQESNLHALTEANLSLNEETLGTN